MPLGIGFGQPPALDQVEIELPVALKQVLFASGQGWHAIKLHKTTMSPNVAQHWPEHDPDTWPGIRSRWNLPFISAPLATGIDGRLSPSAVIAGSALCNNPVLGQAPVGVLVFPLWPISSFPEQ